MSRGDIPSAGIADAGSDVTVRQRIVESLDETLFVEAGAGTGKTTQLVGRIVALIVSGRARIENIAAITFTEAAASELSDRVSESLEKVATGAFALDPVAARAGTSHMSSEIAGVHQDRAAAALEALDGATITTLHGFARRILSEHSFEAGLPPVFEVFDELRSEVEFERRWERFLDRLLDSERFQHSLVRAALWGVSVDHLRTIARHFDQALDLLSDVEIRSPGSRSVSALGVLASLDEAAALADSCTDAEDLLFRHVVSLAGYRDRLRSASGDIEVLMCLASAPKLTHGRGRKENWSGRVTEVREALGRAEEERTSLLRTIGGDAMAELMGEIRRFTLDSAAERRSEGRLGFHDLLVQARELVRRSAEVRSVLHEQYRYLLIDEFQDTDPIQAELAMRIAAGTSEPVDGHWWDLEPEPGRLFFVGDPKQSIYRFRRADVALYLRARDRFRAGSQNLVRNHRSVPGLLAWLNAVFGQLIGDGDAEGQPAYVGLGEHRTAPGGAMARPPVVLLGGPVGGSADEVRREEAASVASTIVRAKLEGWPVGDDGRPACFGDICVLLPSRTALPALEEELGRAGIPYRLEASTLVYSSADITEILLVLRAVDDPGDERVVVGALRTSILGCGDDDLVRFRAAGGGWDYRMTPPAVLGPDDPVAVAMGELGALHRAAYWREPSQLIETILDRRRLLAAALDGARFRERWRRLRFVADQARWYAEAVGGTLRDYLVWASRQSEDGVRVDEAILPESDDDAVRVMTIHKSKGMEFPIVVLAGLNALPYVSRGPRVLWGPDGPEVRVKEGVATAGFEVLALREKELDRFEKVRLLYVAATRARDHLVLSLYHRSGIDCPAALLSEACRGVPEQCLRLEDVLTEPDFSGTEEGKPPPLDASDDDFPARAGWIAERARRLEDGSIPGVVSATAIAALVSRRVSSAPGTYEERASSPGGEAVDAHGYLSSGEEQVADAVPWRRGRSGTAIGRAVHGVLQSVDLATGAGIDGLSRAQALAEGVGARVGEVDRLVRAALASPLIREVCSRRFWREVYVGAPVGERVVEGFIDLLVEDHDGYHVIDYKTGAGWDGGDLDRALARYRPQGAAYALAVEAALGRPVNRCTFLFLGAGDPEGGGDIAIAREIMDLPVAKEEVRSLLGAHQGWGSVS